MSETVKATKQRGTFSQFHDSVKLKILPTSQYGKAFGLSATLVAYYPQVSIPDFMAIDSPLYLNITEIGSSPN